MAKPLVITRIFDAPRELVWKAWTDVEMLKKWWGPKDFTAPIIKMDFKVGGKYHWCMRGAGPDGKIGDFWTTGELKEIIPLEKLVYTDNFSDAEGNVVPASAYGMSGGDWGEGIVTIKLEDMDGKTKMTLTHEGLPEGDMQEQTSAGWMQSLDKMESIL
jgi:uncharacterized protein YndB with AHSA1/START domain